MLSLERRQRRNGIYAVSADVLDPESYMTLIEVSADMSTKTRVRRRNMVLLTLAELRIGLQLESKIRDVQFWGREETQGRITDNYRDYDVFEDDVATVLRTIDAYIIC
jgi:hypothetical protein